MQWKTYYATLLEKDQKYKKLHGSTKIIFAWLPVKLENNKKWIWLEKVRVEYAYSSYVFDIRKKYYEINDE